MPAVDPNAQLDKGTEYTHHLNVQSGGTWSPSGIVDALSGDSNFADVSANVTSAGIITSSIDVTFTYNGAGSNAGQNGQEMASVLNDHFDLSVFEYTGTDSGVVGAPKIPNSVSFTTIAVVLIVALLVGAVFLHETIKVKEVL